MSAKWVIHCGDEVLGPWSSEQVREELRAGRIDAFDLVAMEGSSRKRPLMDVDEIFILTKEQSSKVSHSAKQDRTVLVTEQSLVSGDSMAVTEETAKTAPKDPSTSESAPHRRRAPNYTPPRAFEALAAPSAVGKSNVAVQKQQEQAKAHAGRNMTPAHVRPGSVRRYVLWTPGQKPQGPFTSREVLTFWYSKKLSPETIVQRAGHSKKVNIINFAQFYERAAPSGIAFVGEAKAAGGLLDSSTRGLIVAVIISVLIILGALLWNHSEDFNMERLKQMLSSDNLSQVDSTKIPVEGISGVNSEASIPPPRASEGVVGQKATPIANKQKPLKQAKPAPRKRTVKPPQVQRSTRRPRPVSPPPSAAPSRRIVSQAPPRASKPPPNQALIDGSTVTLSGYRFDLRALNSCQLKCKLPMSGPRGAVTAVFFKEAFAGALAPKSKGVSVTGTIRRDASSGDITILVQSVK
jgi:hypothetical protein